MRKVVIVLLMVLALSSFALAAADVDPALVQAMKGVDKVSVIVQMVPGARHIDVASMGGKLGYSFNVINGFSAELPVAAVNALAKNPNVYSISLDKEIKLNLNILIPALNIDDLWAEGYTGSGSTVAVIDTGIYPHQDFGKRIIGWVDMVNHRTYPYDDHGHGTHCAGIVGGAGPVYRGVAYECNLVGVKVLNSRGSSTWSVIIAGVDWCVANKNTYGIDVISMSLGGIVTQSSVTDPVCAAVRNAWNSGIVVCVAAGNEGPAAQTIGTPGNEPLVITVGASDDKLTPSIYDDVIAYFSSRGPTPIDGWTKPDIVACGVSITACDNASTGYVTMSGTSMATPVIAGICALFLEAHPTASPATVKNSVKGSGRMLAGYGVYDQGSGLVDAYATIH